MHIRGIGHEPRRNHENTRGTDVDLLIVLDVGPGIREISLPPDVLIYITVLNLEPSIEIMQ